MGCLFHTRSTWHIDCIALNVLDCLSTVWDRGCMELDQAELFPRIEERAGKRSAFRQFLDAVEKHGPLIARGHIPVVLDLSRQRVHELIKGGRIATVEVNGREFVPMAALEVYLSDERKNGRPVKELTLAESYRRHLPRLFGS